ncbi:Zinc finger, RING/FYVE/PHD-type [Lasallia pustulata]|uniref:Zinc finger, RING/FYVE/PHD-type n=1 Tax=Lasallia pustulata TaxID=136370 RepID=A0A1W5DCF6_9LECA|nr:Zinc finger, RING/FYVE/PHD-type [Lasallia pustulata]
MPSLLRGRSSRLIRRDDDAPLSRILQLAAAAIAAQLSGTPEQAINMQALGADGLDGSLHTLFQTLQNATTSTGNEGRATEGNADAHRTTPPMNFLRVFRFVNSNSETRGPTEQSASGARGSHARAEHAAADAHDTNEEGSEGRTVTLVLVGVRSVPSGTVPFDDSPTAEPSLDALLSLPIVPSTNLLRSGAGGLLRHADGRSRFTHRRRASMSGVNPFPANYDSQRHQRLHGGSRPNSGETLPTAASAVPMALSESPPGPHPPPSTPADPGLSAYSSGTTTPNGRPSSASATNHPPPHPQGSASQRLREAGAFPPAEDQSTQAVRQRRRSDSEFARHRNLGAGAARRNGVVEPDDAPAQGRTWLIYVVGTNLSEDHPAFATPSLFTDNPTYEDMLLLSSLLGPAKPPVASREDVALAPGLYRIVGNPELLLAQALNGPEIVQIAPGERCLVCLCDYELGEEVRQLTKCSHLFHRECIDEWLTTGRNSCPLCRGQGVDEKAPARPDPMQPSASGLS